MHVLNQIGIGERGPGGRSLPTHVCWRLQAKREGNKVTMVTRAYGNVGIPPGDDGGDCIICKLG